MEIISNFVSLLFCLVFSVRVNSEVPKAPSYIHTCPVDVPDMNACIIQKSKESLPELLKGDKAYKIPNFLPLRLKEVTVKAANIEFKLMDMELYGLQTAELIDCKLDMENDHLFGFIKIPEIHVNGTYEVDGQIMVLPIKGGGPGYLQFEGIEIPVNIDFRKQEKEGYHYIAFENLNIDYTIKNARFNFESLFNGDKALGDHMNTFLNENWSVFHADLKPGIKNMIQTVVLEISKLVLDYVPLEFIFPGWKPT